jgi:hypothetical protein
VCLPSVSCMCDVALRFFTQCRAQGATSLGPSSFADGFAAVLHSCLCCVVLCCAVLWWPCRSSKSTVLWQLSQLQGCPLVPQPPPGSYLLQLIRVPRPLQLPSPRYKMLLSDAECSAASLKHAVVWHLSHGLGCTQVSQGWGSAGSTHRRYCSTRTGSVLGMGCDMLKL